MLGNGTLLSWTRVAEGVYCGQKRAIEANQKLLFWIVKGRDNVDLSWWRACSNERWIQIGDRIEGTGSEEPLEAM